MYHIYFYKKQVFALNRAQRPAVCFPLQVIIFCDITINSCGDDYGDTEKIMIPGK